MARYAKPGKVDANTSIKSVDDFTKLSKSFGTTNLWDWEPKFPKSKPFSPSYDKELDKYHKQNEKWSKAKWQEINRRQKVFDNVPLDQVMRMAEEIEKIENDSENNGGTSWFNSNKDNLLTEQAAYGSVVDRISDKLGNDWGRWGDPEFASGTKIEKAIAKYYKIKPIKSVIKNGKQYNVYQYPDKFGGPAYDMSKNDRDKMLAAACEDLGIDPSPQNIARLSNWYLYSD